MALTVLDGVQVVNTYRLGNGDVWQNVLNYQGSASLTSGHASKYNDMMDTQWLSILKGLVSSSVTFIRTKVIDLTFAPYTEYVYDKSSAGTDGANALPAQTAACLSLHTAHPGRSGRGRVFIGGMTVAALTSSGALTSTYTTALKSWFVAISPVTDGGYTGAVAVLSRKLALLSPVLTVSMDTRADTQRRRANIRIP